MQTSGDDDEEFRFEEVFTVRTLGSLRTAGINNLSQLVEKTAEELRAVRNFGSLCLAEVRQLLAARGLTLRGDPRKFVEQWEAMRDRLASFSNSGETVTAEPDELLTALFRTMLRHEPEEPLAPPPPSVPETPPPPEPTEEEEMLSRALVDPYLSEFAVLEILKFIGHKDLMSMWIRGVLEVEVHTGIQVAPLCGAGYNYMLRYENGEWEISSGDRWIS